MVWEINVLELEGAWLDNCLGSWIELSHGRGMSHLSRMSKIQEIVLGAIGGRNRGGRSTSKS